MTWRRRAVIGSLVAFVLTLAGLPAVASPGAGPVNGSDPTPGQTEVTMAAVPGATSLESAHQLLASRERAANTSVRGRIGSTAQLAAVRQAAADALRGEAVIGTLQALPTPTTVEEEQSLANASTQTYQASSASRSQVSSPAKAAPEKDYMTKNECTSHGESNLPDGWFKSHWSWCQATPYVMSYLVNGVLKGEIYFEATLVGRGYAGTRKVTFVNYINEVYVAGEWPRGGTNLHLSMDCRGIPGPDQCEVHGSKTMWLSKSFTSDTASFTMKSAASGSRGRDKWAAGIFTPKYESDTAQPVGTEHGYTSGFRCDSASYLGSKGACIFDRVRGTFYLFRNDKDVNEAAKHVYSAIHESKASKRAPSVLTRMIDKKRQQKNTDAAHAACRRIHKKTPKGKDCDEYPFKSVRQGVAYAHGHYSVRYISSGDNRRAGTKLGSWYKADRILDGDKFNVSVP